MDSSYNLRAEMDKVMRGTATRSEFEQLVMNWAEFTNGEAKYLSCSQCILIASTWANSLARGEGELVADRKSKDVQNTRAFTRLGSENYSMDWWTREQLGEKARLQAETKRDKKIYMKEDKIAAERKLRRVVEIFNDEDLEKVRKQDEMEALQKRAKLEEKSIRNLARQEWLDKREVIMQAYREEREKAEEMERSEKKRLMEEVQAQQAEMERLKEERQMVLGVADLQVQSD